MITFETITEQDLLRYACHDILNRMTREESLLDENPENKIAKGLLDRYKLQLNEIQQRLIEIEN